MSLNSRKAGPNFGTTNASVKPNSPQAFAQYIVRAAKELGMTPTVKLVSEGLGTIEAEGTFDSGNWGGDGTHIGPWAEEPGFGSVAERMDPYKSTYLAIKRRKEDGSYEPAWWRWETGEVEGTGQQRAHKYTKIAEAAGAGGNNPSLGEEIPLVGGVIGAGEGLVEGAVGGALDAGEFLAEMAETLLDFRKLGHLAVSAFAWFLRLLLKAIWDYVIAPLWHWAERAETWYFQNFFGTGSEKGSGFGYQLRQNAAIITIGFWAVGYGILWTDGTSLSPVDSHESMFGRTVKGIEGQIARRNLVKPKDVERETPDKPEPKSSTVTIERVKEYSVNRKRPVSVGMPGVEDMKGRVKNERSQRVPRPEKKQNDENPEIVKVPERRVKTKPNEQTHSKATADGDARSNSRTDSSDRAESSGGVSGEKGDQS